MTPTTMRAGYPQGSGYPAPPSRSPGNLDRHATYIVAAYITGVARQSRLKPTAGAAVTYRDLKMNANRRGQ
jgi:hypothetical protein